MTFLQHIKATTIIIALHGNTSGLTTLLGGSFINSIDTDTLQLTIPSGEITILSFPIK